MHANVDNPAAVGPDVQALRVALGVVVPTLGRAATVGEVRGAMAIHIGLAADGLDAHADQITAMIRLYLATAPEEAAPAQPYARKRQYVGTWSHTDDPGKKAPSGMPKDEFGNMLLRLLGSCFHMVSCGPKRPRLNRVLRVSIFAEKHQNGMPHYHFPILAELPWYSDILKRALRAEGVHVQFSSEHDYYWTSFIYVATPSALPDGKTEADLDPEPWLSPGHPSVADVVKDIPRGARASDKARVRRFLGEGDGQGSAKGNLALTDKEFSTHAVALRLHTATELLAWVQTRSLRRKDLPVAERCLLVGMEAYCYQHQADVAKRLAFAWAMHDAPDRQELQQKLAWDMVADAAALACECGGVWIPRTEQLLHWNCDVFPAHFPPGERPASEAVRAALTRALQAGCQKHTNVFFYGPNTSGKSHILKPLMEIFAGCCFLRPAGKGNYPLEELFGAKVCVLQDVRATTFKLAWDDLLVWFEGEKFGVPLPRNRHEKDKLYSERAPIFISSAAKFSIPEADAKRLTLDSCEQNLMMDARFCHFFFPRTLSAGEKVATPACRCCFAKWLMADQGPPAVAPVHAEPPQAGPPPPAQRAVDALTDWMETHGGVVHLSGPLCNLGTLADALRWTSDYLPVCGRLLPFLRQHGRVEGGSPDAIISVQVA